MRSYIELFIKKNSYLNFKSIYLVIYLRVMLKKRISFFIPLINDFNVREQIIYRKNNLRLEFY